MNPVINQLHILSELDRTSRILAYEVENPSERPVVAGLFIFLKTSFELVALQDLSLKPWELSSGMVSLPLNDVSSADLDVRLLVRSVLPEGGDTFVDVLPVERLVQSGQTVTFRAAPPEGTRGLLVAMEDGAVLGVRSAKAPAEWTGQVRLSRAARRASVVAYVDAELPVTDPGGGGGTPTDPEPTGRDYWVNPRGVTRASAGMHTTMTVARLLDGPSGLPELELVLAQGSLGLLDWFSPYVDAPTEMGPLEVPGVMSLNTSSSMSAVRHRSRVLEFGEAGSTATVTDTVTGETVATFPPFAAYSGTFYLTGTGALDEFAASALVLSLQTPERTLVYRHLTAPERSFSVTLPLPPGATEADLGMASPAVQVLHDEQSGLVWVVDLRQHEGKCVVWQVDTLRNIGTVEVTTLELGTTVKRSPGASLSSEATHLRVFTGAETFLDDSGGLPSLLTVVREFGTTTRLHVTRYWHVGNAGGLRHFNTETMVVSSPMGSVAPQGLTIDGNGVVYVTTSREVHAIPFVPGDVTLGEATQVSTLPPETAYAAVSTVALADGAVVCAGNHVHVVKLNAPTITSYLTGVGDLELVMVRHNRDVVLRQAVGIPS